MIRLSVLLYQVDGKVTLSEQDYLEDVINHLDWQSPICREAFFTDAIYQTRQVLDAGEEQRYLRTLQTDLLFDADKALEVAMAITGIDGERSDEETELLSLLTHKVLAKALVNRAKPVSPSELN